MSELSRSELGRRLQMDVTDPMSLVITPRLGLDEMMDRDSIDVRLGCHSLLPRLALSQWAHCCSGRDSSELHHMRVHLPLGRYLVLPAHQTVLGSTLEFIKLPLDTSGEILTKSSVARMFTLIETAPWIHPGYRGCLTLEIANVSNTPLLLYPGRPIGQLVLLEVDGSYGQTERLSGKYVGPVFPKSPAFPNPVDELKRLGVPEAEIWTIPRPRAYGQAEKQTIRDSTLESGEKGAV